MRTPYRHRYQILAIFLALAAALLTLTLARAASRSGPAGNLKAVSSTTPAPSPTPQLTQRQYLPLLMNSRPPDVELHDAWTSNPAGGYQQAFLPGDGMRFRASGLVNLNHDVQARLRWIQSGPCGSGEVFSGTVTLKSGNWEHTLSGSAPNCAGIFSSTVQLEYDSLVYNLNAKYVVNDRNSTIQFSDQHGFDRCYLPDLATMQSWMDSSPYYVFNLYIGGISFACKRDPVDAVWVYNTSMQGWAFTLTWVGPQAPCTNFTYRMSFNKDSAYAQGRQEAEDANAAAVSLGFQGNKVIYYDLEGYPGAYDQRCRDAVHAFMRGWNERLQALGAGAGGYGGACSSFVYEWADIQPPPDDVWIAHWYKDQYDPGASVWRTPCVSDALWPDFQRTKQYAGGHRETWGGVALTIDSNKFEGKTVVIPTGPVSESVEATPIVESFGPDLQHAGLVRPGQGWAVAGDNLYWTLDGGQQWQDLTPVQLTNGRILGVSFLDEIHGWMVAQVTSAGLPGIIVLSTQDGGISWDSADLAGLTDQEVQAVDTAYLSVVDPNTARVVVKLQSGSSFSLGRLFATQDGGASWQERSAPAGDPVRFIDPNLGWMVAGPAQDALYRTQDGGQTWQLQVLPLENKPAILGLPWFDSQGTGWLPVTDQSSPEAELVYYTSPDFGDSWRLESRSAPAPVALQEALLESNGSLLEAAQGVSPLAASLPEGAYWVDFAGEEDGWAAARSGSCQRDSSSSMKRCQVQNLLLSTQDGGLTWKPVCGPDQPCFESQ